MGRRDKLALAGAALILLPALLTPAGAVLAAFAAVLWVALVYFGGRYLDAWEKKRIGERSNSGITDLVGGDGETFDRRRE